MLGDPQMTCSVPPRAIQDEHNLLGRPSADLASKLRQFYLKEGNIDRRRQVEDGASEAGWTKPTR